MNDAGANNKNGLLEKGRSGILHVILGVPRWFWY